MKTSISQLFEKRLHISKESERVIKALIREGSSTRRRQARIELLTLKFERIRADVEGSKAKLMNGSTLSPREALQSWRPPTELKTLSSEVRRATEDCYQAAIRIIAARNRLYVGSPTLIGKMDLVAGRAGFSKVAGAVVDMKPEVLELLQYYYDVFDRELYAQEDAAKRQYAAVHALRRSLTELY